MDALLYPLDMLVEGFRGAVLDGRAHMARVFGRCRADAAARIDADRRGLERLRPWTRQRLAVAELHFACTLQRDADGNVRALRLLGARRARGAVHRVRVELHGDDCGDVRVFFDGHRLPHGHPTGQEEPRT